MTQNLANSDFFKCLIISLPFVEVNVHAVVVVDGHCVQGDVGVGQADVDAKVAHDLLVGESLVGGRDLGLPDVPGSSIVTDWKEK